ncbi:MAG: hypothetical protein LBR22_09420 [Desulfovibrio sp.]|jgi:hypothetical protein|nr:hypothetical protein [Desulfovibrio sp.]
MRYYLIDDLQEKELAQLTSLLQDMEFSAGMDGVFWIPVPDENLEPIQRTHTETCGPFVMTLEVEERRVRLELLVRARGRMRCECVCYASPALQTRMIAWLDETLRDLGIVI